MPDAPLPAPQSTPVIVLDTNVVLDAWVFENQESVLLMKEVGACRLHWLTTREMRDELIHVLGRGLGPQWPVAWEALQERWESHTTECSVNTGKPAHWPRCTDKDDQKFIDFALQQKARWLISRDRAVLKLASRCAKLGLTVVDPTRWLKIWSTESSARL